MNSQDQPRNKHNRDPDFAGAEVAMQRAARWARQRANIVRVAGPGGKFDPTRLTFSQTQGYEEIPEPLKLEELSSSARTNIWNTLYLSLEKSTGANGGSIIISGNWEKILGYMHWRFDKRDLDDWNRDFDTNRDRLRKHIKEDPFNLVFDRLQFIMREPVCPPEFVDAIKGEFELSGLAYTIDKGPRPTILPAASPAEAAALIDSLQILRQAGLSSSESHLRRAAERINQQDWAESVKQSIDAVESVARKIDPASRTLGRALDSMKKQKTLHPDLNDALRQLYAYTNSEQGIRHALLDGTTAKAGLDEAVLMLGACASFASYLWRKHIAENAS